MSYTVAITRPAVRDLARLSPSDERRIRLRFDELAQAPFDARRSKPLTGIPGLRSSRVGGWRILFIVQPAEDGDGIVTIIAVRPRGDAYRRL